MALTKAQFLSAFRAAPYAAREFLSGDAFGAAMAKIAAKNSLAGEANALLAENTRAMLLGVLSPKEFVEELKKGGVGEPVALTLAKDVNDLVLKPVRAASEEGEDTKADLEPLQRAAAPKPAASTQTTPAPAPVKPAAPAPAPAMPPPQTPKPEEAHKNLPSIVPGKPLSIVEASKPGSSVRPVTPAPAKPEILHAPAPRPVVPTLAVPPPRTMARDVEALPQTAAHLKAPEAPKPAPPAPQPSRGIIESPDASKRYGADPYREPIE